MEIIFLKATELIVGNTYSILGANQLAINSMVGERFDIVEGVLKAKDKFQNTLTFALADGSQKIATLTRKQYHEGSNIIVH